MAKLTIAQVDKHNRVMDLIESDRPLTHDERLFVLINFQVDSYVKTSNRAFFTPWPIAERMAECGYDGGTVIDMGAGIGILSYFLTRRFEYEKPLGGGYCVVCVESLPELVEVGKRVVPEAEWIVGDVFDLELWRRVQPDWFITNPPFGKITGLPQWIKARGWAEWAFMEMGIRGTNWQDGIALLPQPGLPVIQSGLNGSHRCQNPTGGGASFAKHYPDVAKSLFPSPFDTVETLNSTGFGFADTGITVEIVAVEPTEWQYKMPPLP
jgi:hypothetical protein